MRGDKAALLNQIRALESSIARLTSERDEFGEMAAEFLVPLCVFKQLTREAIGDEAYAKLVRAVDAELTRLRGPEFTVEAQTHPSAAPASPSMHTPGATQTAAGGILTEAASA